MSRGSPRSARAVAADVLRRFEAGREYVAPVLESLLEQTEERQRATDLVYGTIRNLRAIDAVIRQFSGRPVERIAPNLRSIIRVGVYELVYNAATPAYSIVNEAVNSARRAGGRKQTGFVNAVLRQVVRHIADRQAELAGAAPRRTLVQTADRGCAFDVDFLPDPDTALAEFLSVCFSLPKWLIGEWIETFGPEETRRICLGSNRRPSVYIRTNTLRTNAEDLLQRFEEADIQAEIVPSKQWQRPAGRLSCHPEAQPKDLGPEGTTRYRPRQPSILKLTSPQSVTQLPGFAKGWFAVQDLAAAGAVRLLDPQPNWTILDLCAAPGTKTTQLAEATGDAGRIVATDIDAKRLEKVHENVTRLGLKSVTVTPYTQLESPIPNLQSPTTPAPGTFDAVLVDAPCSNTGVLAKRVEVRHRIRPEAVRKLAQTQRGLLEKAAAFVKPGGKICYSTCSIQRSENQDVVAAFLADHDDFTLTDEDLRLPSAQPFDHDGAYAAVLTQQ
ncbi:MAG: methyltransferase domain-containing protein [Sedimentisphaerales bacterium]|nr:methyltransferase domain-containing protein [Sedimentisphaerales bacterium]